MPSWKKNGWGRINLKPEVKTPGAAPLLRGFYLEQRALNQTQARCSNFLFCRIVFFARTDSRFSHNVLAGDPAAPQQMITVIEHAGLSRCHSIDRV